MNGKLPEIWGESLILTLGFRDPISVREKFHCIRVPDLLLTFLLPYDPNFSLIGVLSAVITYGFKAGRWVVDDEFAESD